MIEENMAKYGSHHLTLVIASKISWKCSVVFRTVFLDGILYHTSYTTNSFSGDIFKRKHEQ